MIISRGRSYIFVHIPKTGGTSLALALEDRAMKDDIMLGDTPKAKRRRHKVRGIETSGRLWKHAGLGDIDGLVTPQEIAGMFTFTMVRNPWDRMVSYYHWLQDQSFDHPAVTLAHARDFSGFLNAPETIAALNAQPYDHYMTACDGREYCDAYLRLEHFDTDAQILWDHLGFEVKVPVVNRSVRAKPYADYYSEADRALIADISAADVGRFGYRFG